MKAPLLLVLQLTIIAHNGHKFTTKDNDNDANFNNCAVVNTGGMELLSFES